MSFRIKIPDIRLVHEKINILDCLERAEIFRGDGKKLNTHLGETMGIISLRPNNLKPLQEEIRAERFSEIAQNLGLTVKWGRESFNVVNLSETGLAAEGQHELDLSAGAVISGDLRLPNGLSLYAGEMQIVWTRKLENGCGLGLAFKNHILPRDLVQALEYSEFITKELDIKKSEFLSIPIDFRTLVYEIKNYMSVLKKEIDSLEERMEIESGESNSSVLKAFDVKLGPKITTDLLAYSQRLVTFLDVLKDKSKAKILTNFFHAELNEFYLASPYASRASKKPLGYAGDFEMMNQLYRNALEGKSLFAKVIHQYTVNEVAGKSVRLRKERLKGAISNAVSEGKTVFGSVACGPAQEVVEFLKSAPKLDRPIKFILMDQDLEALVFAKRNISSALFGLNLPVEVVYLSLSVKDILESSQKLAALESCKFDFLYSAGLFDYLTTPVARLMVESLSGFLKEDGKLLVGNFHPKNPTRGISEFAVDWRLIHRTEDEMSELVPSSLKLNKKVYMDELEVAVYLEVSRDAKNIR